jgi:SAM-dependent methyltransferase
MEQVCCIFCTKSSEAVVIKEDGYQGRRCDTCALIYISPRPKQEDISDLYGHGSAHVSSDAHITGSLLKRLYARHSLKVIDQYRSTVYTRVLDFINPGFSKSQGTLLEVGAGGGHFLKEARKKGYTPYAIELNPHQADFINQVLGIPCEKTLLSSCSFGDNTFDVIYHCDVISHFHDPVDAFKIMHTKLADDGLLVFETGNIAEVKHKYLGAFSSFQYPDHLYFFSKDSIKQLLDKTGFELVALHRYNIMPQLAVMNWLKGSSSNTQPVAPKSESGSSWLYSVAKNAYYLMVYVLRYKLGRLLPKKGRPQTLIVVARKKR